VNVSLRLDQKPKRVYLDPQRQSLKFDYDGGFASVIVPTVHGHPMVVFECRTLSLQVLQTAGAREECGAPTR